MNKINPELPDWIARQASLGPNVEVDGKDEFTRDDRFWHLLTVCCPLIFEKYAVILHPFWINDEIKKLKESGIEITKEIKDQNRIHFKPITWANFFHLYNKNFDLNTAVSTTEEIRLEIIKDKWPEYIGFPGEGDLENHQLTKIRNSLIEIYGDIEVYYYYCALKTHDWYAWEEFIYKGKLSKLEELWPKDEIRDNPTAIFPDSKEWCIVSDYDIDISFIGGSARLIEKLTAIKDLDAYEITPKYTEKKVN